MALLIFLAVIGGIFALGALVTLGALVFAYPVCYIIDFKNHVKSLLDKIKNKREKKKEEKVEVEIKKED